MAPAGCHTHRHTSRDSYYKNMINLIHHIYFIHHILFGHITSRDICCKNKLDVLYFVVASFTWLLHASSKNHSYLHIKTTMVFRQVYCFNLLQGPATVKFDSTKVGEQTPASHLYAKLVACLSVEPVSCAWTCKVGPGRFIPQYR